MEEALRRGCGDAVGEGDCGRPFLSLHNPLLLSLFNSVSQSYHSGTDNSLSWKPVLCGSIAGQGPSDSNIIVTYPGAMMKYLTNGSRKVRFTLANDLRVHPWGWGNLGGRGVRRLVTLRLQAGDRWTGMLVISWLSPPTLFIQFVLGPSRGMVPPTSRGFPPPLIFPATALTDTLGCFLGDSKPRHVDSEDILLLPTCENQKYR